MSRSGNVIFGKIIYEKHAEFLSVGAITLIVNEEMKKPVSEWPVNQFGTAILTNKGHRDAMRQRVIARRFAEEEKHNAM